MANWGIIDQTLEGRQQIYFPHWSAGKCPRYGDDPQDILRFRQKFALTSDPDEQKLLKRMCREDLLFYVTTFVWIFESRGDPRPVPFIPYEFQIESFTLLWKCLHDGQESLRIKKPRDMGATYMVLALFEHAWHFMENMQFLLGSRRQDEIDGVQKGVSGKKPPGEWAKLMPKIDFIHLHQPRWLLPNGYTPRAEPYRTKLRIANPEMGSLIVGESANTDWGRGGRYYGVAFDEHAHTDNAYEIISACSASTDCKIWFSSPRGPDTAFAMLGRSDIRQADLTWWMHPEHAEDMKVDPASGDKGRTSPWFDQKCSDLAHDPILINNELWADETQSGGCFYSTKLFDLLNGSGGRDPMVRSCHLRGEIDFTVGPDGPWPTRWVDQIGGCWQLWCDLDAEGNPPKEERYILGADVAAGSQDVHGRGASNSTIAVLGEFSQTKVAEYATHGMPVHKFAQMLLAASRFFCGTERHGYMIWDARGSGQNVGPVIVDDYDVRDNLYWHIGKEGSTSGYQRPGGTKSLVPWGAHVKMLWEGGYVETSHDCVAEMRHFNHNPNGGAPIHGASRSTTDPSGSRENHGDRTTATVLACIELVKRKDCPRRETDLPPRGSILQMREMQRRSALQEARI